MLEASRLTSLDAAKGRADTQDGAHLLTSLGPLSDDFQQDSRPASPGLGGVSQMLRCVQPRVPGLEYFVEHSHGKLHMLTNLAHAQGSATATGPGAPFGGGLSTHEHIRYSQECNSVAIGNSPGSPEASMVPAGQHASSAGTTGSGCGCSVPPAPPGSEYRLMQVDVHAPCLGAAHWQEVVPLKPQAEQLCTNSSLRRSEAGDNVQHKRPSTEHLTFTISVQAGIDGVISDMDMFDRHIVLYGSSAQHALPRVWVVHLPGPPVHTSSDSDTATAATAADITSSRATNSDSTSLNTASANNGGAVAGPGQTVPGAADADLQHTSPPRITQVTLPDWALHVVGGLNMDPHSPTLRLTFSSPVHPPVTADWEFATGKLHVLLQQQVRESS
jgi:hypothetical protein